MQGPRGFRTIVRQRRRDVPVQDEEDHLARGVVVGLMISALVWIPVLGFLLD